MPNIFIRTIFITGEGKETQNIFQMKLYFVRIIISFLYRTGFGVVHQTFAIEQGGKVYNLYLVLKLVYSISYKEVVTLQDLLGLTLTAYQAVSCIPCSVTPLTWEAS